MKIDYCMRCHKEMLVAPKCSHGVFCAECKVITDRERCRKLQQKQNRETTLKCRECGTKLWYRNTTGLCCKCARPKGALHGNWKGGVTYFKKHGNYTGVKYVRCPQEYLAMARKDGYVMEHRIIMARHIGRILQRTEVVHHIDHNPTNNEIDNLMFFPTNQAHKKYEGLCRNPKED